VIESVVRNVVDSADSSALRGGVGGGGAPPALDIRASVGTSTSPTSTGTKAVTGVGFQPKVVLPFGCLQAADGAGVPVTMGLGAFTAAAQAYASVSSANGVTTSSTNRRHSASNGWGILSGASVVEEAAYSSFDANGFTLNWSTVLTTARILNHICLGGADLEVSLVQCQMNGTNAAQSFAHGLSGAPTGVLFFNSNTVSVPPNTVVDLFMSIGAWAGGNQFNAALVSANGVTTTLAKRMLSTSGVMSLILNSNLRQMSVATVNATNVNVTYPITTTANTEYFWMLAIRGAKCQVGTFDTNGSTSPLTISTTGMTPKLFLPVFVPLGVDNVGTVNSELILSIGACDGTNNVSCGISDQNGQTTTNARRFQSSSSLAEYTLGTKVFEGTAAFSGESVVLTPTTNLGATYGQGGYLVIGS